MDEPNMTCNGSIVDLMPQVICCNRPFGNPVGKPEAEGEVSLIQGREHTQSAMADTGLMWAVGKELLVYFINPASDPWVRQIQAAVRRIAPIWSDYANIRFTFTGNAKAHMTVNCLPMFGGPGYNTYSCYLGADCARVVASRQPSTHLIFHPSLANNPDFLEEEFNRVILHEFGHALGFVHEHMRPDRPITWNVPRLLAYCAQNFGWDANTVREQIIAQYQPRDPGKPLLASSFDPQSIMMYQYAPGLATYADGSPFSTPSNSTLSPRDKVVANMLYPATGVTDPTVWPIQVGGAAKATALSKPGMVARFRLTTSKAGNYTVRTTGDAVLLSASSKERDPAGAMIAAEGKGASLAFHPVHPGSTVFIEVRMAKPMSQTGSFSISAVGP